MPAIVASLGTGSAEVLEKMKRIRVMQESLTQKHLAIDSEMLKNAGKGDDGKLGSRLTEITSEVSLTVITITGTANTLHQVNNKCKAIHCMLHGSMYPAIQLARGGFSGCCVTVLYCMQAINYVACTVQ